MDTTELTDDQIDFLAQCEADFANRYTEKDDDFTIVMQIGTSKPPIVEPWRPKGGSHFRSDRRDGRDRDRGDRGDRDRGFKRRNDDGDDYYRHQRRRY